MMLTTHNVGSAGNKISKGRGKKQVLASLAVTKGVPYIAFWHEGLVRLRVGRAMAKGVMLESRGSIGYVDCYLASNSENTSQSL